MQNPIQQHPNPPTNRNPKNPNPLPQLEPSRPSISTTAPQSKSTHNHRNNPKKPPPQTTTNPPHSLLKTHPKKKKKTITCQLIQRDIQPLTNGERDLAVWVRLGEMEAWQGCWWGEVASGERGKEREDEDKRKRMRCTGQR